MRKALLFSAAAAAGLFASYLASSPSDAGCCGGCGGACACGAGPKHAEVPWDDQIATPSVPDANTPVPAPTWTIADLKAGKPLLVYYFVEGLTDVKDDSYKLSQRFETAGLVGDGVISAIKGNWRAKKIALDAKLDRKDAKNQARIEFWSFTGAKMSDIAAKSDDQAAAKPFLTKLGSMVAKNKELSAKEIKRLEDAAKATTPTARK